MDVKYVLKSGGYPPDRAYKDDAGWDLRSPIEVRVPAGGSCTIDTKLHVQIPSGYVGFLKSKSGLNVKSGLRCEGVIDAGYIGSIVAKVYNDSDDDYIFEAGDKIVQLVILPIPEVEMIRAVALDGSDRMTDGFGSTGR